MMGDGERERESGLTVTRAGEVVDILEIGGVVWERVV